MSIARGSMLSVGDAQVQSQTRYQPPYLTIAHSALMRARIGAQHHTIYCCNSRHEQHRHVAVARDYSVAHVFVSLLMCHM